MKPVSEDRLKHMQWVLKQVREILFNPRGQVSRKMPPNIYPFLEQGILAEITGYDIMMVFPIDAAIAYNRCLKHKHTIQSVLFDEGLEMRLHFFHGLANELKPLALKKRIAAIKKDMGHG